MYQDRTGITDIWMFCLIIYEKSHSWLLFLLLIVRFTTNRIPAGYSGYGLVRVWAGLGI